MVRTVILSGVVFAILLSVFTKTWRPRENLYYFYRLENDSLDVINIGSSHVHSSINTIRLYQQRGIASYNLSAGSQAVWYSYYYLKEALKTQNPKVIVLDVYTLSVENDDDFIGKAQLNLLTMRPSLNKLQALYDSGTEDIVGMFMGFPKNHSRYRELTSEEYDSKVCLNMMGYAYTGNVEPLDEAEILDVRRIDDILPITEKSELYLRRIIELCQEKDLEIILVNAPWPHISETDMAKYNYIGLIAQEYGVDFLNGCGLEEELGIDYRTDNAGDNGHLNYQGSLKWTDYLGEYLSAHCDLPDRREEHSRIWAESIRTLELMMARDHLRRIEDAREYIEYLLENPDYAFAVIADASSEGDPLPEWAGMETEICGTKNGYLIRMPDGQIYTETDLASDTRLYADMYDRICACEEQDEAYHFLTMQFNSRIENERADTGIYFIVFDPYRNSALDTAMFREKEGYKRERL